MSVVMPISGSNKEFVISDMIFDKLTCIKPIIQINWQVSFGGLKISNSTFNEEYSKSYLEYRKFHIRCKVHNQSDFHKEKSSSENGAYFCQKHSYKTFFKIALNSSILQPIFTFAQLNNANVLL